MKAYRVGPVIFFSKGNAYRIDQNHFRQFFPYRYLQNQAELDLINNKDDESKICNNSEQNLTYESKQNQLNNNKNNNIEKENENKEVNYGSENS